MKILWQLTYAVCSSMERKFFDLHTNGVTDGGTKKRQREKYLSLILGPTKHTYYKQ